jgi:hypothetical protein
VAKRKGISTASGKAKGRRAQDHVRNWLRQVGAQFGLVDDDIKSAIMGTSGVDIVLSPAARRVFDLDVECKNCETLNVTSVFVKHYETYKDSSAIKLLMHTRNHSPNLVTLTWDDFATLYALYTVIHMPADVPRLNTPAHVPHDTTFFPPQICPQLSEAPSETR